MANPEHLEILKQGVEKWNEWRKRNPEIMPDLSGAVIDVWVGRLIGANFANANFRKVHFNEPFYADGADLQNADFSRAHFEKSVSLDNANLHRANFSRSLFGSVAGFNKSNLDSADFHSAKIKGGDFFEASLRDANFNKATFTNRSNFAKADLSSAKFIEARIPGAVCYKANFSSADLSHAILWSAILEEANFSRAKLQNTILTAARLFGTILDGADLTGSALWETQRAGWSVKGVTCEYIYWDVEAKEKSFYSPGEFERLYADKTKVRLFYRDGINPLEIATIPALIKHLEDSHPGSGLRLVSIREDSGGVVAELAIEGADNKTPEELQQLKATLEAEAQQRVQYQREALAERETRLKVEGRLEELRSCFHLLASKNQVNVQGDYMNDTYNVSGQAGAVGQNAHAHDMTFNQVVNHFEQSIDLPTLAKQLAELREEMAKDSSPQTTIMLGKIAEAEIAAQEKNPSKVMASLKAAGQWTLDFAKEVGKDLAVEAIKQSMGMP